MKNILKCFLIQFVLFISTSLYSQVGIGTTSPDSSSALDIFSTSKGLLMPRLTTVQRDLIASPATGLMIYNTTTNDSQLNIGTPLTPNWIGLKRSETPTYSATQGDDIRTASTSALLVSGMTVAPKSGTYMALFNGQHLTEASVPSFSSNQGVTDLDAIYQALTAMSGGVSHALAFGNGEVLSPGVYDVTGAPSIVGTITMDGGGDSNSVFVIRGTGAFSTGAGATVNLINGASSKNIFWMSQAALSTAAGTTIKGTMISPAGAVSLGANTNLEGSMFTKSGTITMAADCVVTAPSGTSSVDLGVLHSLVMFSSNGAVSDVATCNTTGDVGTAAGALTMSGTHTGEKYPAGTTAPDVPTPTTTYSVYLNGVEVANSSRTIQLTSSSIVSLRAMVTVTEDNHPLEIRWKVDNGAATLKNRTLSLIRSGY